MIPRVVFCAVYLLFWLAYFVLGKLVFLTYHAPNRSMYEEGLVTEDDRRAGKAYLQTAYEDYLRR